MSYQPQPFQYGDFCWIELMANDTSEAKDFYKSIFQTWEDNTNTFDQGEYTMFRNGDAEIAGVYELNDEMKQMGARPFWNSYVKVQDVDATVKQAADLGATIIKEPFDVFEYGRMAVVTDPTGAYLYFWQSKQDSDQSIDQRQQGMFSWLELLTTDAEKARDFYTQLFGWEAQTQEMQPGLYYTSFINNGRQVAGMMQMPESMAGAPSFWNVYFTVENCDAFVADAKAKGATPLFEEPMQYPEVGRFTMLKDPQGASFSVIQFA